MAKCRESLKLKSRLLAEVLQAAWEVEIGIHCEDDIRLLWTFTLKMRTRGTERSKKNAKQTAGLNLNKKGFTEIKWFANIP